MENESLLKQSLSEIVTRLEKAENFVLEEMPSVCKEIIAEEQMEIRLYFIVESASIVTLLVSSLVSGLLSYHYNGVGENSADSWTIVWGALSVIFTIMSFCFWGGIFGTIQRYYSLKVAPKLFILRTLRNLIS